MDDSVTKELPLRRVGFIEGLQHIAGGAALMAVVAGRFPSGAAAGALAGSALLWAMSYLVLRVTRLRVWFGAWDALSFGFVWSYAVVLALATIMLVIQLT